MLYRQAQSLREDMADRLKRIPHRFGLCAVGGSRRSRSLAEQAAEFADKSNNEAKLRKRQPKSVDAARQNAAEAAALAQVQAKVRSITEKASALVEDAASKREDVFNKVHVR